MTTVLDVLHAALPSPCCGAHYTLVNAGTVAKDRALTIASCAACNRHWALEVTAESVPQPTHGPSTHGRTKAATP